MGHTEPRTLPLWRRSDPIPGARALRYDPQGETAGFLLSNVGGGMKRLTNFVLIGPLLIWLTFLALLSPMIAVKGFAGIGEFLLVALLVCYVPGIIPLLVLAGLDELMSHYRVNVWLRVLVSGALGFAVAYALFRYALQASGAQRDFEHYGLWLGLLGGIPAAACSWLSSRNKLAALGA